MHKALRLLPVFFALFFFKSTGQVTYNAYANVTNISGNTFTVSNVNETNHTFAVGEKVVIIQMQDNVIGTNTTNILSFGDLSNIQSAGLYEAQYITGLTRTSGVLTTLTFSGGVVNTYNINSNSRVQVVTFRNLSSSAFTTTSNITGAAWDGTVGGVIALEVGGDFTLAHNISANGIGFRGGSTSTNFSAVPCTAASNTVYIANDGQQGYKGEGIYRTGSTTFANCRGKILNGGGGGNNHNGGGGGGGNYEQGGSGGIGWNNCTTNPGGGLGGVYLKNLISSRVFMGGGGGGGQQNDGQGSAGGNGGGIILIRANRLITSGTCGSTPTISANGNSPSNSGQDGAGGGGAGGCMVFQVNSYSVVNTCSVIISVNGGNGSSAIHTDVHGGGGAGAQGYVVFSTATPTTNVLVTANNGTPGCNNNSSPCTSSAGVASGTNGGGIQPNGGGSCSTSNLLNNPSFEFSVVPSVGNNFPGTSTWEGWTIPSGAQFNVIKTNGSSYSGGPNNAKDGTQYIDINSNSGDLDQRFRVPCTSTLNFSGWFSSRESSGYVNWTASVQIVSSTGSVMGTSTTRNFTSSDGSEDQIWYQVTGSLVVAAGDYTYRARLGDFANFDNAFLCASSCNVLPIELVDFNAIYNSETKNVDLMWQTASEKNSAYFTIERSEDGGYWKPIKTIKAAGRSRTLRNYYYTDSIALRQIMYYRLKQTDIDGSEEYFKTVVVDPDAKHYELLVFPNPSDGQIQVKCNKIIRNIQLLNAYGETIYSDSLNGPETTIHIEEKGVYFLVTALDYDVVVKKVIVH